MFDEVISGLEAALGPHYKKGDVNVKHAMQREGIVIYRHFLCGVAWRRKFKRIQFPVLIRKELFHRGFKTSSF